MYQPYNQTDYPVTIGNPLNKALLVHAATKQDHIVGFPPSGHVPQIDGIDHPPAGVALPLPRFIGPPVSQSQTQRGVRATLLGLFQRRKAQ